MLLEAKKTFTLTTPLTEEKIKKLRAGDMLYLTGVIIGARDMAHKRMIESIKKGEPLPIDLKDQTIFYAGPAPTPKGKKSGSIGPTTSSRMDELTEPLIERGLKATIGKGERSGELRKLLIRYKAIYLVAIGGVSAYLATRVKEVRKIAYHDLDAEAIYEISVEDFPLFVAYDIYGGDIFEKVKSETQNILSDKFQ
ncbi:MAG: fumarate hydratase C-terminal domain-containing protein [Actinobacteria bacterium]|nr:fumarate hydratase C-terminal domain-containing protein [Actinomycetota bacterium]